LEEVPGKNIIFPENGSYLKHSEIPMDDLRKTYLKKYKNMNLSQKDFDFLSEELNISKEKIVSLLE
jgi:hypothetical protein